jgi:hypothetical protein
MLCHFGRLSRKTGLITNYIAVIHKCFWQSEWFLCSKLGIGLTSFWAGHSVREVQNFSILSTSIKMTNKSAVGVNGVEECHKSFNAKDQRLDLQNIVERRISLNTDQVRQWNYSGSSWRCYKYGSWQSAVLEVQGGGLFCPFQCLPFVGLKIDLAPVCLCKKLLQGDFTAMYFPVKSFISPQWILGEQIITCLMCHFQMARTAISRFSIFIFNWNLFS